jgi:hypothetical protein
LVTEFVNGSMLVPLQLGPSEGRVLMVTKRPIRDVSINAPKVASRCESISIAIAVTDAVQPISAVIPVKVDIIDPEGHTAEFSGSYAATNGQLTIRFDFAANDRVGMWEVRVKELARGKSASAYVRLHASEN